MPDNENPIVFKQNAAASSRFKQRSAFLEKSEIKWPSYAQLDGGGSEDDDVVEEERIDSSEIFGLIRSITDPEHPLTLEQLAVVSQEQIKVTYPDEEGSYSFPHVLLEFTPTIPHCSMATLIGLTLRVRLLRALPERFKVDIKVREGTHQSEQSVNKQLNDKERVAAALENSHLLDVVQQCLSTASRRGQE